jgi:PAS domain S-box-containing protein
MNAKVIQLLLVEGDPDDVLLTREYLADSQYFKFNIQWQPDLDKAKETISTSHIDICLVDYRLGKKSGLDFIHFVRERELITPIILLTGHADFEIDLEAMRVGATDFLVKNYLNAQTLERSIRYALSQAYAIRELENKERRYRSLFERSIDPIFLADDGMNIIDANQAMLDLFGYRRERLLTENLSALFHSSTELSVFKQRLEVDNHIKEFEAAFVNIRGEFIHCQINCVFIAEIDPMACCYQGIIRDLTMRHKAERELIMAEKASMTGQMARTIAHEVRNPLTNITLALEQLREELRESDPAAVYTDVINRNANRIEQLITELLNSSKPLKKLNLQLVSLKDLLTETSALIRDRINLNKMHLEVDLPAALPRIYVDPEKVKVALLNILINAVEAMQPNRGELIVRARNESNKIVLRIIDNGKGIPAEDINKLFDPFHTAKPGGMGLGLTATKNIFKSHNIDVEVLSKVGEGTEFRVIFILPG